MRSFGVAPRENHDSTPFYARELYDGVKTREDRPDYVENPIAPEFLDHVLLRDSRSLPMLPDASVHLMVTSPPYNVGKEYDNDLSLNAYLELLGEVFRECMRILVEGGRACVNVANLGRKPYIPLHKHVIDIMGDLGFLMRGEIIWDKSASAGTSTAWGSWKSATNPTLRDVHEYILVFSKGAYRRDHGGRADTIGDREFLEFTKSVWSFPAESAKRVKHPAPFPVELPLRLMKLYAFEGDVVLDPFAGSGTTAIAALESRRRFVLSDISEEYVRIADERINRYREGKQDPAAALRRRRRP
jgi:site-specific DNA-methyltransferase (adenine-specific)